MAAINYDNFFRKAKTLTKPGDMGHMWSKYGNGMA